MQVHVAIEAWRLVLAGRFRLLGPWLDFLSQERSSMRVVNEDQWRQVGGGAWGPCAYHARAMVARGNLVHPMLNWRRARARQVWLFARTVHEDLSNFDPNGAW